jgi:hypothetical protein
MDMSTPYALRGDWGDPPVCGVGKPDPAQYPTPPQSLCLALFHRCCTNPSPTRTVRDISTHTQVIGCCPTQGSSQPSLFSFLCWETKQIEAKCAISAVNYSMSTSQISFKVCGYISDDYMIPLLSSRALKIAARVMSTCRGNTSAKPIRR